MGEIASLTEFLSSPSSKTPEIQDMLRRSTRVLGWDVRDLVSDAHGKHTLSTDISKFWPALFIVCMAKLECLKHQHEDMIGTCSAVAGPGVSEYFALCAAGVCSFEECLRLIQALTQAMRDSISTGCQAMLTIQGLGHSSIARLIPEALKHVNEKNACCEIGIQWWRKGFTCVGSIDAILRLQALVKIAGGTTSLCDRPVDYAFHSAQMTCAKDAISNVLDDILTNAKPPSVAIYSCTGRVWQPGTNPAEILSVVKEIPVSNVSWLGAVDSMIKTGISNFKEVGVRSLVSNVMEHIDADAFSTMQTTI